MVDPTLHFKGGTITLVRGVTSMSVRIETEGQPALEVPVNSDALRDFFKAGQLHVTDFQNDMSLVGGLMGRKQPMVAFRGKGPGYSGE